MTYPGSLRGGIVSALIVVFFSKNLPAHGNLVIQIFTDNPSDVTPSPKRDEHGVRLGRQTSWNSPGLLVLLPVPEKEIIPLKFEKMNSRVLRKIFEIFLHFLCLLRK